MKVWLALGTGKSFRYLAAHKISACLGAERSCALPMFHALLTGCHTLSVFVGHGRKCSWVVWNSLPELTDALVRLACVPTEIPKHSMQAIERSVIHDWTSTFTDVNNVRKKLFAKKSFVQRISPRAVFQGGHTWVVIPGVWLEFHLSHSLCFLLQVAEGGSRPMMDYMNQIGPHYQKHPRPALSWSHVAARKGVVAAASARRLHSNALLCVCVKEDVLQTN